MPTSIYTTPFLANAQLVVTPLFEGRGDFFEGELIREFAASLVQCDHAKVYPSLNYVIALLRENVDQSVKVKHNARLAYIKVYHMYCIAHIAQGLVLAVP